MPKVCRCLINGEFRTVELLEEHALTVRVKVTNTKVVRRGRGLGDYLSFPGTVSARSRKFHKGHYRELITEEKIIKRHKMKHCVTILPD